MPCQLSDLSPELKLTIIDFLEFEDQVALSSTCKDFRVLLIPVVFQTVILRDNEECGKTLATFLDGPYVEHVKQLYFMAYGKGPEEVVGWREHYEPDSQAEIDSVLPEAFDSLFESMASRLSNLESVMVEVPSWDEEELITAYNIFDPVESHEDVIEEEGTHVWRSLLARTYDYLTKFPVGQIRHLEIRNHAPILVSRWRTLEFQRLLNGLESFSMSVEGMEDGVGFQLDTLKGWVTTTTAYGPYLFEHLQNVERFRLEATSHAPIGHKSLRDRCFAELSIRPKGMSKLRRLDLTYVFICPELRDLICAQSEVLESVRLVNSSSIMVDYDVHETVSWAQFFDAVVQANPAKLKSFQILLDRINKDDNKDTDGQTCKEHLLYYLYDLKYGSMPVDFWELPHEAHQHEVDCAAFDRLMALVAANANV